MWQNELKWKQHPSNIWNLTHSETRLDKYVWQADLWLRLPATPTAGRQVKLRKHSRPHLGVVFDLVLWSAVKSVWPSAESLWDESSSVSVWTYLCRRTRAWGVIGLCQPPFFPLWHPRMPQHMRGLRIRESVLSDDSPICPQDRVIRSCDIGPIHFNQQQIQFK